MNRREFLQGTAALGLTGSIVAPAAFGARVSPEKLILFSDVHTLSGNPRHARYEANHKRWNTDKAIYEATCKIASQAVERSHWNRLPMMLAHRVVAMLTFGDGFLIPPGALPNRHFVPGSVYSMYRIETVRGTLVEYQRVRRPMVPDYESLVDAPIDQMPSLEQQYHTGGRSSVIRYRPSEIIHLRIFPTKDTYPYGSSYGELIDRGYTHDEILIETKKMVEATLLALA